VLLKIDDQLMNYLYLLLLHPVKIDVMTKIREFLFQVCQMEIFRMKIYCTHLDLDLDSNFELIYSALIHIFKSNSHFIKQL
jgi:hypothetical protein